MTTASLAMVWLQLLALLATEVGLIAFGVALLGRWSPAAAWRRTFCQAGITAVLVVTACELSGSARVLGGWAASARTWRNGDNRPRRAQVPRPAPVTSVQLDGTLRSESEPALVGQTSWSAGDEPSAPPLPTLFRQPFPDRPAPTVPTSPDSVSDSMGVLVLCLVWVVGSALAGGRLCLAQCLFMALQRRRRPVAERALAERVEGLARALRIGRRVRVVESEWLTSPIAFGLIRPTVGLPVNFAVRFDPAKRDAMLAHELAHLAAHDPFWCLLANVATVVLWWHPGVWWLRRQLHLASEMAADEASLLVADGPRVLAECLVELGARLTRPMLLGQLRVSGFRSHLGRRVQQLVHLEGRAWSPPPRLGTAMMRILGPMAMTAIVVLCTAWAAPQALTKGDSMKMMRLNWKRSLATFAFLAAFNGPEATVAVAQSDKPEPPPAPAPEVAPAALAAPAKSSANWEATEAPSLPKLPPPPPAGGIGVVRSYRGVGPEAVHAKAPNSPGGAKLEAKLKQIVLPEVTFDNLPLGQVLRFLSDESVKRDPDKTGVNFLINPNVRPVRPIGAVNPATGRPMAAPAEGFDVAAVNVNFDLPLRHVTMRDLLDAIMTVADHPIEYAVRDYAVVFSAKPETVAGQAGTLARPGLVPILGPGIGPRSPCPPTVLEPSYRMPAGRPAGVPPPPGLVSWWPAEGSAADIVGGNNGSAVNVGFAAGKVGQAFVFDGSTSSITVPASPSLTVVSFTIEGWINLTEVCNQQPIAEYGSGDTWSGVHLWISVPMGGGPGTLFANLRSLSSLVQGRTAKSTSCGLDQNIVSSEPDLVPPNQWSHIALTFEEASGTARLYLNGTNVASRDLGPIIPDTAQPLNIGLRPEGVESGSGARFSGKIDELSLYNRALTAAEIRAIFKAGSAGKHRPPRY